MSEDVRAEVERRLGKPFGDVKDRLVELFDLEWDEVEVVIETSVAKGGRSRADVIVELVERTERRPAVQSRVRKAVIRWIGKPWRERENPWERFKGRVPPLPPRTDQPTDDLDEWTPTKPDEE